MNQIEAYKHIIKQAKEIIERCKKCMADLEITKQSCMNSIVEAQAIIDDAQKNLLEALTGHDNPTI